MNIKNLQPTPSCIECGSQATREIKFNENNPLIIYLCLDCVQDLWDSITFMLQELLVG